MSKHEVTVSVVIDGVKYGQTIKVGDLGLALGNRAQVFGLAAQSGEVVQRTILQHFIGGRNAT